MKLQAIIAGLKFAVDVRRQGEGVIATIDGRAYELEAQQSGSSIVLRTADGKIFDCRVEGNAISGETVDVFVGPRQYAVTLTDPKRLRSTGAAGSHADGAARMIAAMPGKVVCVMVEQGATVEAGAGIFVVEAMKMQNEMKAPKSGVVITLNATVGATVNGGDVLAVID